MKATHVHPLLAILLIALVAFRPWKQINHAFGLRDLTDSIQTGAAYADTMILQQPVAPVQVVLSPVQVDSLHEIVADKKAAFDSLKVEEKKLDQKLTTTKQKNQKKQASLVTEEQIQQILAKQTQKAKSKPVKDFDPDEESDLEKDVNRTPRPGMARLGSGSPK